MELTCENVKKVFDECLFKNEEVVDGKPTGPAIEVEGIMSKFGFHKERTLAHTNEIVELLKQLPDTFKKSSGGGWSFLNACHTANGIQWGEHRNMEQLFALGIAVEKAEWCAPRELWPTLPGGMPYVVCDV